MSVKRGVEVYLFPKECCFKVRVSVNPNPNLACEQALRGALEAGREKEGELATTSLDFDPNSTSNSSVAWSRLRDGGGKSFSNKKCEKRAGAGERQGRRHAPFPKSCPSYFRFARFNTFPLVLSESLAQGNSSLARRRLRCQLSANKREAETSANVKKKH